MSLQAIIASCRAKRALWEDPEFPATDASLGKVSSGGPSAVWLRPQEFISEPAQLFENGIRPDDIQQGRLGDCYFLSSLSVLSEAPERIQRLFRDHEANSCGAYCVTFFLDGAVRRVLVDDRIPCDPRTRSPLFSRNKGAELWVLLAEKAYAKAYGSYAAIEAGSPADALADLTGAPVRNLRTKETDPAELVAELAEHDKRGHVMCAGCPDDPSRDLMREVGLVEGHAYALLAVYSGTPEPLLELRNPWGRVEWRGAWSDDDPRWTPEFRKRLGAPERADDGTFWMNVQDFCKYFNSVTVVPVEDSWVFCSVQAALEAQSACFALSVPSTVDGMFVTMHQRRGKKPLSLRMCIADAVSGAPVGGTGEAFRQAETISTAEMSVPKGKYIVLVEVYTQNSPVLPIDFAVSCYSSSQGVRITTTAEKAAHGFVLPEFSKKYGLCAVCNTALSPSFFTERVVAPALAMLTDFGSGSEYVGIMKGVVQATLLRAGLSPEARCRISVIDLFHDVSPQSVRHGAWVLRQSAPFFPKGTVFLCVVDPGVGSTRRAVVVQTSSFTFVGPDNVSLDTSGAPSKTFHGRDVFAPAAAMASSGVPVGLLGRRLDGSSLRQLRFREEGEIVSVDSFGNVITNAVAPHTLTPGDEVRVRGLALRFWPTYADAPEGALFAIVSSAGTLEIAVRNASAIAMLPDWKIGDPIDFSFPLQAH
eukprot:m51a1_g2622 putative calpain family cysteine protease (704) ;mRNA; f:540528-543291